MVTAILHRYRAKEGKLSRKDMGLDESAFKSLDKNGDGVLV